MRNANFPKHRFILPFLAVLFALSAPLATAETLIYNNSIDFGYSYSPGSYDEVVDYGTSSGGNVVRFTIGYYTSQSNPGTITIRFYDDIDDFASPYYATTLKTFNISGLPGFGTHYRDYSIPIQDQFNLPSGDFGYSYELTNSSTDLVLASGGTGNDNLFWGWIYDAYWGWEWSLKWFGGIPHAGFYMKVYTAPFDPTVSDITGYKFDDTNANGTWDLGEPNLPGWEIYLDLDNNGQYDITEPSVITDQDGYYKFAFLSTPDVYTVAEISKPNWTQTLPGGDGTYAIVAEPNQVYTDINFGNTLLQLCSISGTKFHDFNGNGVRDAEPGLPGWEIYLDLNENGEFDSAEPKTITDSNGDYEMPGLLPGTYTVAEVPQCGWKQTAPLFGGAHIVNVANGEVANNVDFGNRLNMAGDFDGDEDVDDSDLEAFGQAWLTDDSCIDIVPTGGDGIINVRDFGALAANWLEGVVIEE